MFLQDVIEIGTPDLDEIDASSLKRHLKYIHKIRRNLRQRLISERNDFWAELKN